MTECRNYSVCLAIAVTKKNERGPNCAPCSQYQERTVEQCIDDWSRIKPRGHAGGVLAFTHGRSKGRR